VDELNAFVQRNLENRTQSLPRRRALRHGFGRGLHHVRRKYARTGLVRQGGYDPARQALETATINGADLLGMAGALGALRPGYLADIVAVE
jgi:imidazolonepropionase-like amidohydrolase